MINFFKDKQKNKVDENESYYKIASLLIHTAKIDENYTKKEEDIIKKTLIDLGANSSVVDNIVSRATVIEENSNQILDFTKEIKSLDYSDKIKIVESLWKIIYSNNDADMYETNLMRRLSGLLYIDAKIMGELKEKIKKSLSK
jgi:uncharacterized tellurite resistance protein B-like protein|tara:strand:+ start:540 stop:968 length:429 start_codon:yes stop_codon:yes gene_type:complete